MEEFLRQFDEFVPRSVHGVANILDKAVGCLGNGEWFLGSEVLFGGGLNDGWGGAFEVAYTRRGQIEKLDDVVHVFWTARVSSEGINLSIFPRIMKTSYRGSDLLVRTYDWANQPLEERLFVVRPVGYEESSFSIPPTDLWFQWLCPVVLVVFEDGSTGLCSMVNRFGSDQASVKFKVTEETLEVLVHDSYFKQVRSEIARKNAGHQRV